MGDLFTFELDMGSGVQHLNGQQLEDLLYNCLDFCLLYGKRAHFFLIGADAAWHPGLWHILEILHQEGVSFSLLSEPEREEYETFRRKDLRDKIRIRTDGEVVCEIGVLGNALRDRLGDLWEVRRMQGGKTA